MKKNYVLVHIFIILILVLGASNYGMKYKAFSEYDKEATCSSLSEEEAINIASVAARKRFNDDIFLNSNGIKERNGRRYFVINIFKSKKNTSSALACYYVDGNTGNLFEWDIKYDKLIPVE